MHPVLSAFVMWLVAFAYTYRMPFCWAPRLCWSCSMTSAHCLRPRTTPCLQRWLSSLRDRHSIFPPRAQSRVHSRCSTMLERYVDAMSCVTKEHVCTRCTVTRRIVGFVWRIIGYVQKDCWLCFCTLDTDLLCSTVCTKRIWTIRAKIHRLVIHEKWNWKDFVWV